MAALAKDRNTPVRDGTLIKVPVAASAKIHAGALVVRGASGNAAPGSGATGLIPLGRAEEAADNSSGSAGAISVTVRRGVFRWENSAAADAIAAADIGSDCWIVDDQTVAKTSDSSKRSKAGRILGVDSSGVWVLTG